MRRGIVALLSLAAAAGCSRVEATAPAVRLEMRHVDLHLTPEITLQVRHLSGALEPSAGRGVVNLDDTASYRINVAAGEVAIDLPSLNATVARALGSGRSNVDRVRLTLEDGRLRQKGTIDKGIDIPFTSKSTVGVTSDGRLRIHTESVKGFGVPIKPLMKLFGVQMDNMLRVRPESGIVVDGNDLILDPSRLLPPPVMVGKLTAARIEGQMLVQTLGGGEVRALEPPALGRNHLLWRGGRITFGKLTMSEADLEVMDEDPRDPLDFSADDWNRQLTAGYSKVTARRGLQAHVPDYNDLRRANPPPRR